MCFLTTFWILFSYEEVSFETPCTPVRTKNIFKVLSTTTKAQNATYEGAQVWRTTLRSAKDILVLKKLVDHQDISMWNLTPNRADFLVLLDKKVKVNRCLETKMMNHTVLIMNVQRRVDTQKAEPDLWDVNSLRLGHRLTWKKYPTPKIIDEYFTFLSDSFSSISKVQTIGYSAENRSINMITISNGNPDNKRILVISGMHSREWAAITSTFYILNNIVTKFDQQPDFIKNKDWLIIPIINPDGFVYSHTHDRLWRKNRRKFQHCVGVDINRNFETDWNITGITEKHQCKEAYAGPLPFSEPESIALRDVVKKTKPSAVLDLHSYGQLILYPWGGRFPTTPDVKIHKATAEGMSKAMNTSTHKYKFGATYRMVYPATGSAIDWTYSSGVKLSFAIETRDTGAYGFLLPSKYIEATGKDMLSAVKYLAQVLDERVTNRGRELRVWF